MWEFNLPRLDMQEGSPELQQVKSYLYQLTDQLRYWFSNIGTDNLDPELSAICQNTSNVANSFLPFREEMESELVKLHNEDKSYVDKVVAKGVTSSWYYRKWDSGRCEAWRNYNFTTDAGDLTAFNGMYYDFSDYIALPFTFKSLNNFQVCVSKPTHVAWAIGNTEVPASNATAVMVLVFQSDSTAVTHNLSLSVSGTWK